MDTNAVVGAIWWKVERYSDSITRVVVVKESEQMITIQLANGRRDRAYKVSQYGRYFASFDEAKAALVERLENAIKQAKAREHAARSALGSVRALTPDSCKAI